MSHAFLKALLALFPACLLLLGSGIRFRREKVLATRMQLIGASALVLVVVTHMREALHLFAAMHWGQENGAGHYLDLVSAVIGFSSFPTGYLMQAFRERR